MSAITECTFCGDMAACGTWEKRDKVFFCCADCAMTVLPGLIAVSVRLEPPCAETAEAAIEEAYARMWPTMTARVSLEWSVGG